ncbi:MULTISPECIES: DUF4190 domain-containing protein [unclassified Crossiella]|uniref:DUF4190 domain-containing protein n=1 Tax=unclassified Crossiella TaxID=2620835 RepID=UPI0027E4FA72|nr:MULTISPECIES: DUF4190 domain-containing protein [unclassified Crossiella]
MSAPQDPVQPPSQDPAPYSPATAEPHYPAPAEPQYPVAPEPQYPVAPEVQYPVTPEVQYPVVPDAQYQPQPPYPAPMSYQDSGGYQKAAYPGYQQQGYPGGYQQGYPQAYPQQKTNGMSVAALVCGIIPFFILPVLGIIFGAVALNQIKQSGEQGRGMALAGLVVGCVWVGLFLLFFLIPLLFVGSVPFLVG